MLNHKMRRLLYLLAISVFSNLASAAETNATPEQIEAKYTAAIEGRTTEILKLLTLPEAEKKSAVHDLIVGQYRALKAWHEVNDTKLKAAKADTNLTAEIRASLKTLHQDFIIKLSVQLTPEQVETVKDKLTYGKVQFTFAGYLAAYPNLAEVHQSKILELLKQAREEAMDGGSAEEKTAVFKKYKGKINNYLSQQGVHLEKQK